jgi:hypothetical protein
MGFILSREAGRAPDPPGSPSRLHSLEPLGIPADHISIVVRDIPTTNWGIRGGAAACDIDLGFDVNV